MLWNAALAQLRRTYTTCIAVLAQDILGSDMRFVICMILYIVITYILMT